MVREQEREVRGVEVFWETFSPGRDKDAGSGRRRGAADMAGFGWVAEHSASREPRRERRDDEQVSIHEGACAMLCA